MKELLLWSTEVPVLLVNQPFIFYQTLPLALNNEVDVVAGALHGVIMAASVAAIISAFSFLKLCKH